MTDSFAPFTNYYTTTPNTQPILLPSVYKNGFPPRIVTIHIRANLSLQYFVTATLDQANFYANPDAL